MTLQPACLPGLPTPYDPLMQVTTPWPRTILDYATVSLTSSLLCALFILIGTQGNVSDMEHNSVASLFNPQQVTFGSRPETLVSLRTQSLTLAHKASELAAGVWYTLRDGGAY